VLRLEGVTKSFGDKRAVDQVSLVVPTGQLVGVIGRSGAGKSTLLRMINRLGDPSRGRIVFGDTDITALKGRALRHWRARCAMIFQQFNLAGRLDVLNNVMMGRAFHVPASRALLKLWSDEEKAQALSALESLDMARLAGQRADTLSGGQQQRVAIARALVQEPDIILADEPIASLDPRNTKVVMDALLHINKHFGITVVCNLHSLDIARSYCDRLVGMAAGRVVFDDVPAALTDAVARDLYGLEAGEVVGRLAPVRASRSPARDPVHAPSSRRNPHAHPSSRPGCRTCRIRRRRHSSGAELEGRLP
jgi:phosphonate transport system ATP-binding protein